MRSFFSVKSNTGEIIVNKNNVVYFQKLGKKTIKLVLTSETLELSYKSEDERDSAFTWLAQN